MNSMVPKLIEYTAINEDGEVVEGESDNSDVQTDDSDDSGDGDDDDPSHPLAMTIVNNYFNYDKQDKASKFKNFSFRRCIELITIFITEIKFLLTNFSSEPFPIIKIHFFVLTFVYESLSGIINFIINGGLF